MRSLKMRSKGFRKPGLWKAVLSILLVLAGGGCLLVIGAISRPCGAEREVITYVEVEKRVESTGSQNQVAVARTSGVRNHGDLCGMSESKIEELLSMGHESGPWGRRYSWDYRWWTILEIRQQFEAASAKDVECILISVKGVVPCLGEECLLTVHVRPHTSDIEVVLQLFDKVEYSFLENYTPRTILDAGGNVGLGALLFGTM